MKHLCFLLVFISNLVYSQNNGFSIKYLNKIPFDIEEHIKSVSVEMRNQIKSNLLDMLDDNKLIITYVLENDGVISKYETEKRVSNNQLGTLDIKNVIQNNKTDVVYKNPSQNYYIHYQPVGIKKYAVKDSINKNNWEFLDNNERDILNYRTKSAILINNNFKTVAYYTEDLKLNDGPFIYYNLPGLILKIEYYKDDKLLYEIEAIDINLSSNVKKIKIENNLDVLSQKEIDDMNFETLKKLKNGLY